MKTVMRIKKENCMVLCTGEVWGGIQQEVISELVSEAFVYVFPKFLEKLKSIFQDIFLLVKLKNILVHLTQNSYLKKESIKSLSGEEMDI